MEPDMRSLYSHLVPASSPAQQLSASASSASRAVRSRSASHPIKTAFLSAKKALQSQFINPASGQPHSTPAPHLDLPNLDNKASTDALRFKSTLFSAPSNPEISSPYISRQPLEPVLQMPQSEPKLPSKASENNNRMLRISSFRKLENRPSPNYPPKNSIIQSAYSDGLAQAIPLALTNVPVRPTRSNMVDPDLMVRVPLPVIVSSLVDQPTKKRSHRRRWTTQRSKNPKPLETNDCEPFDLFLINPQGLPTSENAGAASYSRCNGPVLKDSVDQQLSDDVTNYDSSSSRSFQLSDHSDTDCSQLPVPYPINNFNHDNQEHLDIDDLTTPTLKSCERFEDDNSITPCQTYSTPNFNKRQQAIRMTPRMIYEDYQRKLNQEDAIIKSTYSKLPPRRTCTSQGDRPLQTNHSLSQTNVNHSNDVMPSATVLYAASLNDTSSEDPSDESFESFGDEQFFGALLSTKSQSTRKSNLPLISTFPLPPAARSPRRFPSNSRRTPSPKLMSGHSSQVVTPENRILMDGDKRLLGKSRSSSLLVLGNPLRVNSSPKNYTLLSISPPSNRNHQENPSFQFRPSPYRHVEHASNIHEGPDHLESSTRLMMFDSFLEGSPKSNGSNASPRSSLSRKSPRKLKFDESPLKKISSLHFPETPQPSVTRDTFGRHTHRTPFTMALSRRPSGLAFELSTRDSNVKAKDFSVATDSTSFGTLLSSPPSANGSPISSSCRNEHPSPASDSDDEPSHSPQTPYGNFFTQSNHLEPYVPTFEPTLTGEGFSQKLDAYSSPNSKPISLEVLAEDGPVNRFLNLRHRAGAPIHDEGNAPRAFHEPQLRHKGSAAKLAFIADGILSRFTNQRGPKESLYFSESDAKVMKYQRSATDDEGFNSSLQNSNWTSIIEHDLRQSRSNASLNNTNADRQKAPSAKPLSGRILFGECNHGDDLNGVAVIGNQQATRSNNPDYMTHEFSLKQLINLSDTARPYTHDIRVLRQDSHTSGLSLAESGKKKFESLHEILVESGFGASEKVPTDAQQILSPIRLYGKQQGVLETGNWKTNNLNFQSMKSQYQLTTSTGFVAGTSNHNGGQTESENLDAGATSRRDRTLTEETQKQNGGRLQEEEEAEREKKESLMVYKIQEEDENQIITFEINRLKRIFHHKALKSSKSKSKLSSKALVKLFEH